ncbi:hypothetical protein [Bacillus wiedmannii]|uniref:hypothetical protein n=1 Tax=Bacillus wiedmannii TaxID=1890302 RepID=UPI000BF3074C|nr:hypothetical protein [Bacillus wiedmannii]PFZ98056.1 hypothetical protein COL78_12615 [Bacillus wiedmannii]
MDKIIDVFKNRPGKSLTSLIAVVIGVVTIVGFQEVRVETLADFFDYLTNSQEDSKLITTWFLNLVSFSLNIVMAGIWAKEILRDDCIDDFPEIAKIVSLVMGFLHFVYALLFLSYIFSKLLGLVIAVVIVIALLKSGEK